MNAILIGSFTILSSFMSALLGYYFASANQQRMLTLEYDKLRAERTLDISKALTRADASLQAMIVTGFISSERYCKLAGELRTLQTDLAKVREMPKVYGTLAHMLTDFDRLIQTSGADEAVRQDLALRLSGMQRTHEDLDNRIQADWKVDDEIKSLLDVDTSATMKVYYPDYSIPLAGLSVEYGQIGLKARELILKNGECRPRADWEAVQKEALDWSNRAFQLTTSLGLALSPAQQ